MESSFKTFKIVCSLTILLFIGCTQIVNAQGANKTRDFFHYSNNEAYRWLSTLAHPLNVFRSGNCNVSGNNIIVTINAEDFLNKKVYTIVISLHKKGNTFDSIEIVDDNDRAPSFIVTSTVKFLLVNFWRAYSSSTISSIEKIFGSLSSIRSEQLCLPVLTALYWKYNSNGANQGSYLNSLDLDLTGRIGDNLESRCKLTYNQSTDLGNFSYELSNNQIKRILKLVSYDVSTNSIVLKEYTRKGEVVGSFYGTLQNGSFKGYFTNLRNGATIPFSMNKRSNSSSSIGTSSGNAKEYDMTGRINYKNNEYRFKMHLNVNGRSVKGKYYVTNGERVWVTLSGTINSDGIAVLREYKNNQQTGYYFEGHLNGGYFVGKYKASSRPLVMSFSASPN